MKNSPDRSTDANHVTVGEDQPKATEKQPSIESLLQEAQSLAQSGQLSAAKSTLRRLLIRQPDSAPALFLAANLEASQENWSAAVNLLAGIPVDHPEAGLAALGQSADWLTRDGKFDQAERKLEQLIQLAPGANLARRRLANLLNRQGKREAASKQVRALVRLGDVVESELHSLLSVADAFYDGTRKQQTGSEAPIGPLGKSRVAFAESRLEEAIRILDQVEQPLTAPESAFLGRVLAETQQSDRLPAWLTGCPQGVENHGDFWTALGTWMSWQSDDERAVAFLCEAIVRVPTDRIAINRLDSSLRRLGETRQADVAKQRSELLLRTHELGTTIGLVEKASPDDCVQMAELMEQLRRPFEALMWRAIAAT
ncbi:MAG: tetratricopeptide repeat protein, partial [Planctomycetota bacterium]